MGWEVLFSLLYGGVGRRGHSLRGGWSHSPPVGEGGDVDDSVLCVGGGYEGFLFLVRLLMTSLYWWGGDVLVCGGVVAWRGWVQPCKPFL